MVEEWRKIEGFPDYMVSNQGRVCSVRRGHPIILKVFKNTQGYLHVNLCNENKKICKRYIHRLVASAFISNPNNKPEVNHIYGNKANNNMTNLEWVTGSENTQHAFDIGLKSHAGVNNPRTHLTEAQVIEIYKLSHTSSLTQNEIGKIFEINQVAVSFIKNGKNWKELTQNINIQSQRQV